MVQDVVVEIFVHMWQCIHPTIEALYSGTSSCELSKVEGILQPVSSNQPQRRTLSMLKLINNSEREVMVSLLLPIQFTQRHLKEVDVPNSNL